MKIYHKSFATGSYRKTTDSKIDKFDFAQRRCISFSFALKNLGEFTRSSLIDQIEESTAVKIPSYRISPAHPDLRNNLRMLARERDTNCSILDRSWRLDRGEKRLECLAGDRNGSKYTVREGWDKSDVWPE